jgi:hypothetical protein
MAPGYPTEGGQVPSLRPCPSCPRQGHPEKHTSDQEHIIQLAQQRAAGQTRARQLAIGTPDSPTSRWAAPWARCPLRPPPTVQGLKEEGGKVLSENRRWHSRPVILADPRRQS